MSRAGLFFVFCTTALLVPAQAQAYMGPTLGLGVIGAAVAVIVVLLLSLFAFVWVPVRRMLRKMKRKTVEENTDS